MGIKLGENMKITDFAKDILETRKAWSKVETVIPNIFIRVIPPIPKDETQENRIIIEYNPIDEKGKPMLKNGLFLHNLKDLEQALNTLSNNEIVDLFNKLYDQR
jgi:hypothetical protein